MKYFFRHQIIDADDVRVDIMSPTVQYGLNVFEGIRGYYDPATQSLGLVALQLHIERLLESARCLNLQHHYTAQQIDDAIRQTIRANAIASDIYLRVVLLFDAPGSWQTDAPAVLLVVPVPSRPFDVQKPAVSTKISSWERINGRSLPPRIKAGANYLNSRLAQQEARQSGCDVALFLNTAGFVAEAPGSCIFTVCRRKFYTPSLTSSILGSITRLIVIDIIRHVLEANVDEVSLERVDLYQADEALLCGTAMEVTPVQSVDHIRYQTDAMTRAVMQAYHRFIYGDLALTYATLTRL